jgi:ankyrin repeat protein
MLSKFFKNTNPTIVNLEKELFKDFFSVSKADNLIKTKKINLDEINKNGNTLLHVCLKNHKYKGANWLIINGASLAIKNKNNISTMRIAVEKGNLSVIKTIIKYANEDINQVDANGRSLLQDAVILGNKEVARELINASIDINIIDKYNRNVSFDAIASGDKRMIDTIISLDGLDLNLIDTTGKTILDDKKVRDDKELSEKLLDKGATSSTKHKQDEDRLDNSELNSEIGNAMLNISHKYSGNKELKTANKDAINMEVMYSLAKLSKSESTRRSGLKYTAKTLVKNDLDINAINKNKETLLFDMVRSQDIEGCAFLLEHGINVNHKNSYHETALSIAILRGIENLDIVVLLLQYDADPTIKNRHNETIAEVLNNIILHIHDLKHLTNKKFLDEINFSGNYLLLLKEILLIKDIDFSYLDSSGYPLFFTPFLYGSKQVCKLYFQYGLDINTTNNDGHNIFYEYVQKIFHDNIYIKDFRENLIFLLVNLVDINSRNVNGQTIYSKIALEPCNLKLFRKLIEVTRYDYTSTDHLGRTILHSCVWSNNLDLLKLVYGVDINIQNISDKFNILPITYAALLGNKDIAMEFLRRNTIITSGKNIPKIAKENFQPMLKNLDKLTINLAPHDNLRKLEILKEQVLKDFSI